MDNFLKYYTRPSFLLCTAILAVAAIGISLTPYFEIWLEKEPIGLKKPLTELSNENFGPFTVVKQIQIESQDVIDSLGTDDYVQIVLADGEAEPGSPCASFMLFITYYGKADSVPHVPEECYTGGGFRKDISVPVSFHLSADERPERKIPGRYVTFKRANSTMSTSEISFPVLYLFSVNCEYANTRTQARYMLGKNIRGKHSYFSKVEMVFNQTQNPPEQQDAVKTCEKLLKVLLPVLEKSYWPDAKDLKG